jgi:hypothetical protein
MERPRRPLRLATAASTWLAIAAAVPGLAARGADESVVQIDVETPEEGALVGDPAGMAFIAGRAIAHAFGSTSLDIVFVIDRSESTSVLAGADVNGDGEIGYGGCAGESLPRLLRSITGCSPWQDTVLGAELSAVRALVGQLDPTITRVGIVVFSGDGDQGTPDASLVVPLSSDFARIERGLEAIEQAGPMGRTNLTEGLELGAAELAGKTSGQEREPGAQPGAQKILLLLSDGAPTLPFELSLMENAWLTVDAARAAARLGIRIDTFGVGPDAMPTVLESVAQAGGGRFTPVSRPGDLQALFAQLSLSRVDALRLRNRTNGKIAEYARLDADGSFSALLQMQPGRNIVELTARATDGSEHTRTLELEFLPDADAPALSPRQAARRNRLMENWLADLRERSVQIESERDQKLRRELRIQVEKAQREQARERLRRLRIEPGAQGPDTRTHGGSAP